MDQFLRSTEHYNKEKPRIAHLRFFKNKPVLCTNGKYDRVVSLAWFYNVDEDELEYGATVWTKDSSKDHWCRKTHRECAVTRYYTVPVQLRLDFGDRYEFGPFVMDWFIASHLIYTQGVFSETCTKNFVFLPPKQQLLAKFDYREQWVVNIPYNKLTNASYNKTEKNYNIRSVFNLVLLLSLGVNVYFWLK